jgi:F-type H+-transporting ATPase subunit gamma
MSRRREVEHHRHSLGEIREIMSSMKTLAYLETRKLDRFLSAQQAVVESVEKVAADFLTFYPETLPESRYLIPVYLLIGSERGFCGDYNHIVARELESVTQMNEGQMPLLLAVGRKLHPRLESDPRVVEFVSGASVVEEVSNTLTEIVNALTTLQQKRGPITLYGLYHDLDGNIVKQKLLPPLRQLPVQPKSYSHPPQLNLLPRQFLLELTDHYLFAALHEMLYTALMAENQARVSHLEGAVRRLDEESAELARRSNALRQEEIIEEIEVILLSAAGLDEQHHEQ